MIAKKTKLIEDIDKLFEKWFRKEKGHKQHYKIMGKGTENWFAKEFGLYCYKLGLRDKFEIKKEGLQ